MRPNRKQIVRAAAFSTLAMASIFLSHLILICHPNLFFPYNFTRGGITLHSDEPIPPEPAGRILEEVEQRLARSPLAAPPRIKDLRVYICNRRWLFVLFANTRYKAAGIAYSLLSGNIFLRTVHFHANHLVRYSGQEATGARTLSYYITHEIVHILLARELGIVKQWRLPAWKN